MATILANGPEGFGEYWTQAQIDNYVALWGEVMTRRKLTAAYNQHKFLQGATFEQAQSLYSTVLKKAPRRLQELNTSLNT